MEKCIFAMKVPQIEPNYNFTRICVLQYTKSASYLQKTLFCTWTEHVRAMHVVHANMFRNAHVVYIVIFLSCMQTCEIHLELIWIIVKGFSS